MSSEYLKALNIGSGLDTKQIVDAIIAARKTPKENFIKNKIADKQTKTSSFGEVKNAISSFETNLSLYSGINGLSLQGNSTAFTAQISDPSKAKAFSHSINVSNLATSQTLVFGGFSSATTTVGTGTLNFAFGTWNGSSFAANGSTSNLTIPSGNNTLEGVADFINDASIGVNASVVKSEEANYALVLRSPTGASNAIQVTATEDDVASSFDQLNYTTYDSSKEVSAASDSVMTIDGVEIKRTTNTITDLVDGVTLTLNAKSNSAETFSAAYDVETAQVAMQGFVAEINALTKLLRSKVARGTETKAGGDLPGDPLVRSIIDQITTLNNEPISGFGASAIYLANFGVLTNRDGTLSLDATKFRSEFNRAPDAFNAVLNSRVTTGSAMVSGSITGTDYVPGNYSFAVNGNAATLDGAAMTFADSQYSVNSGNASGLIVEITGSGASTDVFLGRSLLDKLKNFSNSTLAYGNDIDERIANYNTDISEYNSSLANFEKQMENLKQQYINQFAAMDASVASLNRTKESLTAMMDGWNSMMRG